MNQEDLIMYFVVFILSIFVLRVARFTATFFFIMVKDSILYVLPSYEKGIKAFFLKIDFLINKMQILGIRWHFIVAFAYTIYGAFN